MCYFLYFLKKSIILLSLISNQGVLFSLFS
nr:MAG TPA: hypothetical protein [Caudoviricetes sp.]